MDNIIIACVITIFNIIWFFINRKGQKLNNDLSNILFDNYGHIKLADFGLSKDKVTD